MDLQVLDTSLNEIGVIDKYNSVIWAERYYMEGDFEIFSGVTQSVLDLLQYDYFVTNPDSDYVMIVEARQIKTDEEFGNVVAISGRSLEYILERRLIWGQVTIDGNLQDAVESLLNDNIISPTDPDRQISNFIFEASTDPAITSLTLKAQYNGDNLFYAIKELCEAEGIGFKVRLVNKQFVFSLYAGADRSYDQFDNPYVVFSPKYDNLLNSNYIESRKELKTVAFVAGEGEGSDQVTTTVESPLGGGSGLSRREVRTDATGISSTTSGGTLPLADYLAQLEQKGLEDLATKAIVEAFEGQFETTKQFIYGESFGMGDIIQVQNEYGIEAKSRIIEIVRAYSDAGNEIRPTFATLDS